MPTTNERLGYAPHDRLLLLHADDVGMCHSANVATLRAMTEGGVLTASVMVPCPWFPEIAQYAREHPERDFGIHLTHTSEWQTYRWGPVASRGDVPGLLDDEGFLHRRTQQTAENATPAEIEIEIRAQIARARQFGMTPTHMDSHMDAMMSRADFAEVYIRLGKELGVLPMLTATERTLGRLAELGHTRESLEAKGYLFIDQRTRSSRAPTYEERRRDYHDAVRALPPGLTLMIMHLNTDDPEAQAITSDWPNRFNELRIFTEPAWRALLEAEGVKLIGYRPLAALFNA